MTIDEAIERLTDETVQLRHRFSPNWIEALKLGIEALKLVDNLRFEGSPYYPKPLPGETED